MRRKQADIQAERSSINERIAKLELDIAGETEGESDMHTQNQVTGESGRARPLFAC